MRNNVLVSVLMPIYNGEKFLKEAIDSILCQTYKNFELIIVDDGSTDNSVKIINSYADKRIRLVIRKYNSGIVDALNEGLGLCNGKYIARMDADDIARCDRFELQVRYLEKYPNVFLLASLVNVIDEDGLIINEWKLDKQSLTFESIKYNLLSDNCMAHSSVMFRREGFGEYSKQYPNAEDYGKWLELIFQGRQFAKIPEELINYRHHTNSISSRTNLFGKIKSIKSRLTFIKSHKKIVFDGWGQHMLVYLLKDIVAYMFDFTAWKFKPMVMDLLGGVGYSIGLFVPMRIDEDIVFFLPDLDLGGSEQVHLNILKVISKNKRVLLFVDNQICLGPMENDFERVVSRKVINISKLVCNRLLYCLVFGYIASIINKKDKAVIFGSNNAFYYRVAKWTKESIKKIDLIHALGGGIEDWGWNYVNYLDKRIVITRTMYKKMLSNYTNSKLNKELIDRIVLIDNYVDVPEKLTAKDDKKNLRVLFVGRGEDEKRPDLALRVAKKCISFGMKYEFIFVGKLERYFNKKGLDCKHVDLRGEILDRRVMTDIYKSANILILTSSREGFPLVIFEAMAYGLVPICTDVGGIKDHLNRKIGFTIAFRKEEEVVREICNKIIMLDKHRLILRKMSRSGYEYVKGLNLEVKFKEKYLTLFSLE